MEIWAAAVVYALGSNNFLFDKSFAPYATGEDICNFFGTSKSTTAQKSKVIRDMFKMGYYDRDFSTKHMKENSPFPNLVMINGLIVDKRYLPPEVQEMLKREGK
jgi:hypothetical protein